MTTAARPTFDPAKGGSAVKDRDIGELSHQVSSRDLPSHLKLKERLQGQDTAEELKERDFRAELEERERIAQIEKSKEPSSRYVPSLEQATQVRLALKAERDREREAQKEALLSSESVVDVGKNELCPITIVDARKMAQLDKDEDFGSEIEFSESDFEVSDDDNVGHGGDDDDDDDEDDPVALMAELNRIKQERLAEEQRRENEREEKLRAGPVSNHTVDDDASSTFSVKRRWDDDVPFKNCAREEPDPKRKLFVNDTLRQEFHKRFMDKYIR